MPTISVTVRRFHDTGKPGWFILLPFTIIGLVPYHYWTCFLKGDPAKNAYGENPLKSFIENPDTLKLSSIEIDNACYQICDGEISISISGGSSPYTVSWKDSLGVEFDNINTTIEDLCPALYVLDYTDNNGCVASDTLIVEERDSFN